MDGFYKNDFPSELSLFRNILWDQNFKLLQNIYWMLLIGFFVRLIYLHVTMFFLNNVRFILAIN